MCKIINCVIELLLDILFAGKTCSKKEKKTTIISDIVNKIDSGEIEDGDLEMIVTAIGLFGFFKITFKILFCYFFLCSMFL